LKVDDSTRFTVGNTYLLAPAGGGATAELIRIAAIDDAATVTLAAPLAAGHATTDTFENLTDGTPTALSEPVSASAARVLLDVASAVGITAGGVILLDNGTDSELAIVTGIASVVEIRAVPTTDDPAEDPPALGANHPADVALVPVTHVMTAHARYPGAWGDALRLTLRPSSLVSTMLSNPEGATATTMVLDTAFGLFPGSVVIIGEGSPARWPRSTPATAW
jgi:hypothetical protein